MNQYEAMFLFDPTFGSSFEKCEAEVRRLMDRAGAEIIFCRKWDERRLAYKIQGRKRGVYVLVYFNGPGDKIGAFERDAKLSEVILRLLLLRADGLTHDAMEKTYPRRSEDADRSGAGEGDRAPAPPPATAAKDAEPAKGPADEPASSSTTTAVAEPPPDKPA